jgi:hypothetical protein
LKTIGRDQSFRTARARNSEGPGLMFELMSCLSQIRENVSTLFGKISLAHNLKNGAGDSSTLLFDASPFKDV